MPLRVELALGLAFAALLITAQYSESKSGAAKIHELQDAVTGARQSANFSKSEVDSLRQENTAMMNRLNELQTNFALLKAAGHAKAKQ